MNARISHTLKLLSQALVAFRASKYAKTTQAECKFIANNAHETANVADDSPETFDFGAARAFFDYISARTIKKARIAWQDFVAPVAPSPVDPRPVLYFEQDGKYFTFRDRPFYTITYREIDGVMFMPEYGTVCPQFCVEAPMRVRDFNMDEADKAAAWFVAHANLCGYRAERAPSYDDQPAFDDHPAIERADILLHRSPAGEDISLIDFAMMRGVHNPADEEGEPVLCRLADAPQTPRERYKARARAERIGWQRIAGQSDKAPSAVTRLVVFQKLSHGYEIVEIIEADMTTSAFQRHFLSKNAAWYMLKEERMKGYTYTLNAGYYRNGDIVWPYGDHRSKLTQSRL